MYYVSCECHADGDDKLHWVDGEPFACQGAWMFHLKSEDEELPNDECGASQHILIDSGAPLHLGPADLLHRRCGKVPGRRLATVTGESMEYDGQSPAQKALEDGVTVHAEFAGRT